MNVCLTLPPTSLRVPIGLGCALRQRVSVRLPEEKEAVTQIVFVQILNKKFGKGSSTQI